MPYKDVERRLEVGRKSYNKRKTLDVDYLLVRRAKANAYSRANKNKVMFFAARKRARDKNVPFDLVLSDIVIPDLCPVFNKPFEYGTPFAASIDRINPSLGYTKDNIQIISYKANTMKNNASSKELKEFASWISRSTN